MYAVDDTRRTSWQRLRVAAAFLLCAGLIAIGVEWRAQELTVLSVQSGSMAPLIQTGDAVAVRPASAEELRPGDVISFYDQTGSAVVTHRIIATEGGIVTQGDANPTPDGVLDTALLIGRVERRLARAGLVLDFARSLPGLLLLVYIPALYVICGETRRLIEFFRPTYRHPALSL